MRRTLGYIRGWGIALGTSALILGGATTAAIKFAGELRDLSIAAYRANTSLQTLFSTGNRAAVAFGDFDLGRQAALDLAAFTNELSKFQLGLSSLNIGGLVVGTLGTGLSISDFLGGTPEQIHANLVKAIRHINTMPAGFMKRLQEENLKAAVPESVFNAALLEATASPDALRQMDRASRIQNVLAGQEDVLRGLGQAWGLVSLNMRATTNEFLVGMAPALNVIFTGVSILVEGIGKLFRAWKPLNYIVGTFFVILASGVAILSTIAIITKVYTLIKLAYTKATIMATIANSRFAFSLVAIRKAFALLSLFMATNPLGIIILGLGVAFAVLAHKLDLFGRAIRAFTGDVNNIQTPDTRPLPTFREAPPQARGSNPATAFARSSQSNTQVNATLYNNFDVTGANPEELSAFLSQVIGEEMTALTSSRGRG